MVFWQIPNADLEIEGHFSPERSRLSLDSLQKLEFSSCHLFGFSQPPGLIYWRAGGVCGLERLGQVEQGSEIAGSLIFSHPKYLSLIS